MPIAAPAVKAEAFVLDDKDQMAVGQERAAFAKRLMDAPMMPAVRIYAHDLRAGHRADYRSFPSWSSGRS